jgi:CO/xanthine dehydrogenase Mo-binding subunit
MKKRGVGVASMYYAIGYGFNRPDHAAATIEIADDGSITLISGCCDIGQGSDTVLSQIAAEELGVEYEDVHIISADTAVTPDSGASTASRQTFVSGNAVKIAAQDIKRKLFNHARELLDVDDDNFFVQNRIIYHASSKKSIPISSVAKSLHDSGKPFLGYGWYNNTTPDVNPETNQGDAYATYCFATQVVEVEVDTETGKVDVLNVVAIHDVGKAINPVLCEGQIEGGVVQGMGYGLFEEVKSENSVVITKNFDNFLIPTAADIPNITSIIVEDEEPKGPYGAKGVGEPSLIPTAPAIINAIYDAIGVRIFELPANLERIKSAVQSISDKGGKRNA